MQCTRASYELALFMARMAAAARRFTVVAQSFASKECLQPLQTDLTAYKSGAVITLSQDGYLR